MLTRGACSLQQELFDPMRWIDLQSLFQQDLYRLHSLTFTSLLNIHLQVDALHIIMRKRHMFAAPFLLLCIS